MIRAGEQVERTHAFVGRLLAGGVAAAVLVLATLVAFGPAVFNDYVGWDDGPYIVVNPLLRSFDGLRRIWFTGDAPIYYPLTFTSFWLETQLGIGGPEHAGGTHFINLVLHAGAGVFFWRCLLRLGAGPRLAWLAAALWLVHPLQVESVVWATERKNVLSGCLYLASAWCFLRAEQRWRSAWYATSIGLFAAALLSKTAGVGWPVVLLFTEWLRGRRLTLAALGRVGPFLLLSVIFGLLTLDSEHPAIDPPALPARLMIAGQAFWFYLLRFVWPFGLSAIYPRWSVALSIAGFIPLGMLVAVAAVWLWAAFRERPWQQRRQAMCMVALVHYAAMIGLALGIIPWPLMDRSFVANHLAYLALLAPAAVAPAAVGWLGNQARVRLRRFESLLARSKGAVANAAWAALLLALTGFSLARALEWRDTTTLMNGVLRRYPQAPEAHAVLAAWLEQDRPDEALQRMRRAVELSPKYVEARTQLGRMLIDRGAAAEALPHLEEAVRLAPVVVEARLQLLRGLIGQSRFDDALARIESASPRFQQEPQVIDTWARVLSQLGNSERAIEIARRNCADAKWGQKAYLIIATAEWKLGRHDAAVRACDALLKLNPRSWEALLVRARARGFAGDRQGAERDMQEALQINAKLGPAVDALRQSFPPAPETSTQSTSAP
ncbi:MAG: Lipopolysaccharide assembly protein B [Phycisphaerae bacterium]|nr:Lipopolysaccharide assembly protein B [Phycisphaerae bacterium]